LFFIFSWAYGICIGIFNVDHTSHVFRNYLGLSLYAAYPIIVYYWKNSDAIENSLVKISILTSIALSLYCAFQAVEIAMSDGGWYSRVNLINEIGMTALRLHYSANIFLILAGAYILICNNTRQPLLIMLLIFIYLLSFSKPAIVILGIFIALLIYLKKVKPLSILFLLLPLIIFSFYTITFDQISNFFYGIQFEEGNLRSEQADYLVGDWSLFGHGLGSALSNSDYVRDSVLTYNFELTYHNLIHKLGIFSLLIFIGYLITILYGLMLLLKKDYHSKKIGGLVIILMSYVIVGYGNPVVFNPICVMEHLLTLALIRAHMLSSKLRIKQ
jgi:ABC-type multidrug transport system fused ATPase/permease subunit